LEANDDLLNARPPARNVHVGNGHTRNFAALVDPPTKVQKKKNDTMSSLTLLSEPE